MTKELIDNMYRKYYPPMVEYAYRIVNGNYALAEEAVMDAFANCTEWVNNPASEHIHIKNPEAWLRRIVKNASIAVIRGEENKGIKYAPSELQLEFDFDAEPFDEQNIPLVQEQVLKEAFNRLGVSNNDKVKSVINLFFIYGLTHKEISSILGISEKYSKNIISKVNRSKN